MERASISSPTSRAAAPAFTLVEVIVAVGLLGVAVLAMLAVQGAIGRSVAESSGYDGAAQLVDAITLELGRLRDRPAPAGQPGRLEALAALIPTSENFNSLRLVASRDGMRVSLESEADQAITGILPGERYYLVEVRQEPASLGYAAGAGFLAVALSVKWPYQIPTGPEASQATPADPAQASVAIFHAALLP